jgi:predicted dehydrogenase
MATTHPSRRDFVGSVASASAAFTIVPRHVLGGPGYTAPSDKLNIACIGVGGMGENDVKGVSSQNIYALCDVDLKSAEDTFRKYPAARKYRDYREMLDLEQKNIDAVTITIPDHSHAAATMMALRLNKNVYCQKPLARTLTEVRTVKAMAAKTKVATQMGNQGHTGEGVRTMREWVEAGVIGTVREVQYWTNRPIWPQGLDRPLELYAPPLTMDWNLWLGPAAERPYNPAYAPFRWRGWWDFGTGALGDMACHGMDAAYWILDLGYPERIMPESTELYLESAPKSSRVEYQFPAKANRPAVKVVWRDGDLRPPKPQGLPETMAWPPADIGGQLWIGDDGAMIAGMYGEDPVLLDPKRDAEVRANPPVKVYPRSKGVYDEWIDACKGGPPALSTFDGHAGALTEMVLLGVLAIRAGQTLELNASTGAVTNMTLPERWVTPEYRKGWTL